MVFNHGSFLSLFWMKIHSKLNEFRIKILDSYIISDLRFLLEIQAILPETSPFLAAQMAVLSSFFQKFLVFEMYSFHCNKINNIWLKFVFLEQCAWLGMNCLRCRCWLLWWCCDTWCKMAVLSSFFQMFIVLRMYNFACHFYSHIICTSC